MAYLLIKVLWSVRLEEAKTRCWAVGVIERWDWVCPIRHPETVAFRSFFFLPLPSFPLFYKHNAVMSTINDLVGCFRV